MNKVQLIGRLTRDVEMKYTEAKDPLAIGRFSVAVNRRFKKDGEQEADFINCVAFGKQAEFISKYFSKGQMIALCGRIQTGSYTDKDGNKRNSFDIVVEETEFCGGKQENHESNNTKQNDSYYSVETGVDDDNLPF